MKAAFALFAFTFALHAAPARVLSVVEPEGAIGKTLTLRIDGDPGDCKALILFIQRSPIHGITARCGAGTVAFDLAVNAKNAHTWHDILGGQGLRRVVTVGLGPNETSPFETHVYDFPFRVLETWRAVVIAIVAILLFSAIVVVRRFTTLLDALARVQIAIFAVVITISYVFIWSVTGETETINATALALLAIGAGTAVGSAILKDVNTVDPKAIVQAVANEGSAPAEIAGPNGLHALTIGAWTFVLAIVFLTTVFKLLQMPDFSAPVLAVLGISGGTYLAFSMQARR